MKIELTTQAGDLLKAVAFQRSITPSDVILDALSKGQQLFDTQCSDADFERFWRALPKEMKVGKLKALAAWKKTARSRPKIEMLLGALAKCTRSKAWNKRDENGRRAFMPHAATWLNRGGWHDEMEGAPVHAAGNGKADPTLERRRRLTELAGRYQRNEITEAQYDAAVTEITKEV